MKNANDVLRQKESDLARVRTEIHSLKIVAALLAADESGAEDFDPTSDERDGKALTGAEEGADDSTEATGTNGLFSSFSHQNPRRWKLLKRHR